MPYLSGEASVADRTLEGSLLGVAPVVDLQGGVAGERFEADVAGRVAPHRCNHSTGYLECGRKLSYSKWTVCQDWQTDQLKLMSECERTGNC